MNCRSAVIVSLAALPAACSSMPGHEASVARLQEVARKGMSVMPFDLARTTHSFDDRPDGGVETVAANDKADLEQAALIRSHLAKEARLFARGDFSDPARIHGRDMPGLAALAEAGGKLQVSYRDVAGGGSIAYTSAVPTIVTAIHQWFAAQRADHASHGHMHEHMHP